MPGIDGLINFLLILFNVLKLPKIKYWILFNEHMVSKNEMDLHYDITKTKGGQLIGQCFEFPSVIAYAKTEEALDKQVLACLHGYFDAFPTEKKSPSIIPKQIKHIPSNLL
jgi:hypothetical protein